MTAVLRNLGIFLAALVLAASVADASNAPVLAPDRVQREVASFVTRADPFPGHRISVEFVGAVRPLATATGATVRVSTAKKTEWAGRTSFLVETRVGDRVVGQTWVATQIRVYAAGFKVAGKTGRGHEFGDVDLVPVEVDLGTTPSDVLLDRTAILGRRAKQVIAAGTVLPRRLVETPPLMKRGDVVTIVLNAGSMVIKAAGQVVQDGFADQRVQVVNLETKRAVFARVVDRNTVRIEF